MKSKAEFSRQDLVTVVQQAVPQAEEYVMTLAEQWKQEGLEKGRQEGLDNQKALVLELLAEKFGPLDPFSEKRVREGGPEDLRRWAKQILRAETVEDALK